MKVPKADELAQSLQSVYFEFHDRDTNLENGLFEGQHSTWDLPVGEVVHHIVKVIEDTFKFLQFSVYSQ